MTTEKFVPPSVKARKDRVKDEPKKVEVKPPAVSSDVGKALDLAYNATRDKLREVTVIDRYQGRLLPLLDVVNTLTNYLLQVSEYRYDSKVYATAHPDAPYPEPPNLLEEFIYRNAQWAKSVNGAAFNKLNELVAIEMEARAEGEDAGLFPEGFED